MTDQLVSFETAKLAQEKGFEQSQPAIQYTEDCNHNTGDRGQFIKHARYTCVTQSLLQKWLREVHKIHIGLILWGNGTWDYTIIDISANECIRECSPFTTKGFKTFEDALEQGLIEALKLLS